MKEDEEIELGGQQLAILIKSVPTGGCRVMSNGVSWMARCARCARRTKLSGWKLSSRQNPRGESIRARLIGNDPKGVEKGAGEKRN